MKEKLLRLAKKAKYEEIAAEYEQAAKQGSEKFKDWYLLKADEYRKQAEGLNHEGGTT